jgi:hypothetical protein
MTDRDRRAFLAGVGASTIAATRAAAQGGGQMTRIDFETAAYTGAITGSGAPAQWELLPDPTAPTKRKVLAQTSSDKTDYRFPLAIFEGPSRASLDVSLRFKPVAGEVDRAAGIAVRLRDRDNYYVVRANALEDNVRLYRMVDGRRSQFAGANAKVPSGVWQELGLKVEGNRFEVFLEGKSLYTASDATFAAAGRMALWTKADSTTYFDDLRIG